MGQENCDSPGNCAWQPGLNLVSHTKLQLRLFPHICNLHQVPVEFRCSVVTAEADGSWSLLSAALQCRVLTRSPVVPLYSKNITIKKKTKRQNNLLVSLFFPAAVVVHKQQTAFPWCSHLGSESPGIQRPNWIFSALPLHAPNIFYSWCKSDGEDCSYRLTGVCSRSTGSIALVKAIRKQHSKPQNVFSHSRQNFISSVLGKRAPKIPH